MSETGDDNKKPVLKPTANARSMSPRQLDEVRKSLLNRPAPAEYLTEWEERVASPTPAPAHDQFSVLVFEVAGLWLAADIELLVEITEPRAIHRVPHRTNPIFLGVVNIRGQLRMCASLAGLMKVTVTEGSKRVKKDGQTGHVFPRMVMLADSRGAWVFPVDEVVGVLRFMPEDLSVAPVTVSRAHNAMTKGVIKWEGKQLDYIDPKLLFSALHRSLA
jgi:chemotaxis-related protein WspD